MAIFGKKKTGKTVEKKAAKSPVAISPRRLSVETAKIIVRPHITEKSGMLSQNGTYTFEVTRDANTTTVAEAVEVLYKVVPVRVSILPIHPKSRSFKGKPGLSAKGRKAYVYLKKGDTIEFI